MNRCLYCYQELAVGDNDFHSRCAKKIFSGVDIPSYFIKKMKLRGRRTGGTFTNYSNRSYKRNFLSI